MEKAYSLGIVGCGLTGTSMFYQLVDEIRTEQEKQATVFEPISIIVFEKSDHPGPGLPYAETNVFPCHISNMPASDMSIVADQPNDFIDWINTQVPWLKAQYPEFDSFLPVTPSHPAGNLCLPRSVMGQYLKDRFDNAVNQAHKLGVVVSVQTMSEVIDIDDLGDVLSIQVMDRDSKNTKLFAVERMLLATGHWDRDDRKLGFFPSPWPAANLVEQIPLSASTAVLGTGLSAIDTVLTLFSDGIFESDKKKDTLTYLPEKNLRQATMYSRNGLLPKVRGRIGSRKNRYLTEKNLNSLIQKKKDALELADIFELLDRELAEAYGNTIKWGQIQIPDTDPLLTLKQDIGQAENGDNPDGDILWQTILAQATPVLKKAYLNLNAIQRSWFEKQFKSVFMTYAAVIPIVNARKLVAFMKSGCLMIHRLGSAYQLRTASRPFRFKICYQDENGNPVVDRHHYVVDATGQSLSYRTNPSKLAQNIIASGLVRLETLEREKGEVLPQNNTRAADRSQTGGVWVDPVTFRAIEKTRAGHVRCSKKVFVVGIMNRGQILNASMAYECAASTKKVAQLMVSELSRRTLKAYRKRPRKDH